MTEYLDIVDDEDNVLGRAQRSECHERKLTHRSVQFFIFDEQGKILVNRRSSNKEFFGGMWSIVLGGHVSSGQTYDEAVMREANEEANVTSTPFKMGYFKKRLVEEKENVMVYGFKVNGSLKLLEEEIEYGQYMTYEQALEMVKTEKFIPETQ
ncbi:MAG: NUDIX domain-containing protein, partial [Candidatus Altiarchaeota archaeon]|nr:NUDIX domain-containing protein [Candidatus Altiarchaeota archaeon]